MKIDGYTPPDKKIATETGVEFHYITKFGDFYIRAKSSGKENEEFRKGNADLALLNATREKTGQEISTEEAFAEYLGLWHDTIVISWRTTIKSGGKEIEPTRENFIELLSNELFSRIFSALTEDCRNHENFQREAEAEIAKK